jgi:hypothetical protein
LEVRQALFRAGEEVRATKKGFDLWLSGRWSV